MSEIANRNKKRAYIIFILTSLIWAIILYFFIRPFKIGYWSIIIALIIPILISVINYLSYTKIMLSLNNAKPAVKDKYDNIYMIIDELSKLSNIPTPKFYIIPDSQPNAFAIGKSIKNSIIGLTIGLIKNSNENELRAVIAHEIIRIKNYDTLLSTVLTIKVGMPLIFTDSFSRKLLKKTSKGKKSDGWIMTLESLTLSILSPISAKLLEFFLPKDREIVADKFAVSELNVNPQDLINIITTSSSNPDPFEMLNTSAIHTFFINPIKSINGNKIIQTFTIHTPIAKRITALSNLEK